MPKVSDNGHPARADTRLDDRHYPAAILLWAASVAAVFGIAARPGGSTLGRPPGVVAVGWALVLIGLLGRSGTAWAIAGIFPTGLAMAAGVDGTRGGPGPMAATVPGKLARITICALSSRSTRR